MPYSIDQDWDDPFEQRPERRRSFRHPKRFRCAIGAHDSGNRDAISCPGMVMDVSTTGVRVVTGHALEPGDRVELTLPTLGMSEQACLPDAFHGQADVVWSATLTGSGSQGALAFGNAFLQNMEFSLFLERLFLESAA